MKKFGFSVLAIAMVMLMGTAGAEILGFGNDTVRYKVSVTVETPEGVKTGSAVREVRKHTEPSILPEQGGTTYNVIKGEAVVVDLGARGVLFALIGGQDEARNVYQTLKNKKDSYTEDPAKGVRFVRFRDLKDPKTVEAVKPEEFDKVFGEGVKLGGLSIIATNEDVVWGLKKWIPWFDERRKAKTKGAIGGSPDKPFEDPSGTFLTSIDFSKGEE